MSEQEIIKACPYCKSINTQKNLKGDRVYCRYCNYSLPVEKWNYFGRAIAAYEAILSLDAAEQTFTAGFHAGPDEWHVGGSEDNVRVSSSLAAALIALAGEKHP